MLKKEDFLVGGVALALGILLGYLVFSYYPWETKKNSEMLGLEMGLNNKGWEFFKKGELNFAQEEFENYIENNPRNAYAHFGMGSIHLQRNKYMNAFEELSYAHSINQDIPKIVNGLGMSLYSLQRYSETIPYLEEAANKNPKQDESIMFLGRAYLKTNNFVEARKAFLQSKNTSDSYYVSPVGLFLSAYGEGNMEEAQILLEEMWPHILVIKGKPDERFMAFMECAIPRQKDAAHVFECGEKL